MTTKIQSVGSLQKGSSIILEGAACRVVDTQTSRPGKHGHAKVRLTAGLILTWFIPCKLNSTGSSTVIRFFSGSSISFKIEYNI